MKVRRARKFARRLLPTAAPAAVACVLLQVAVPGLASPAQAATAGGLDIAAVYAEGGAAGATYQSDFVELFNSGDAPASLSGLSLQFASSSGAVSSNVTALDDVTLQPGQYFLLAGAAGSSGAALPVTPDQTDAGFAPAATVATVFLVSGTTALASATDPSIVDEVGYGETSATPTGTDPAPATSLSIADVRQNNGCFSTGDNAADFASADAASMTILNSASAATPCSGPAGTTPTPGTTPTGTTVGLEIAAMYGAGNQAADSPYQDDFVELFNAGTSPASLGGLSLQYAAANAAAIESYKTAALSDVTLAPGQYFLVQAEGGTSNGGQPLPATPDETVSEFGLNNVKGAAYLVAGTTTLGQAAPGQAAIIDMAGYGSTTDFAGAGPAPAMSDTSADFRGTGGKVDACTATGSNAADFFNATIPPLTLLTTASSPTPCAAGTGAPPDAGLVIDSVYAGAGSAAGTAFGSDFVQLFNASGAPIPLSGLSVQFTSSGGTVNSTVTDLNDVTLPPGGSYLLAGFAGTQGQALPVAADQTATGFKPPATNGTVLVADSTTAVTSGSDPSVIDEVGYGSADDFLGAATAPPTVLTGAIARNLSGCLNSRNNAADFGAVYGADLVLADSASTPQPCSASTTATPGTTATGPTAGLQIAAFYGAGAQAADATFEDDFVELINAGTHPASLAGLSLQYSQVGKTVVENYKTAALADVTLQPGQFFLVQGEGSASHGAVLSTPADQNLPGYGMNNVSGSVYLVAGTTGLTSLTSSSILDEVGYGSATAYRGKPAPALSDTLAAVRKFGGCSDTGDNAADFTAEAAATLALQNQSSAAAPCGQGTPSFLDIAAVYGGGGADASFFASDFVELFNSGSTPASLNGLSLQVFAADGTPQPASTTALDDVTLQPGEYYLVSGASAGGGDQSPISPDPDQASGALDVPADSGTVALVYGTGQLTALPSADTVDEVGTGSAADTEGSAAPVLTAATGDYRGENGCANTGNNATDFSVATAQTTPLFSTASPVFLCSSVPKPQFTAKKLSLGLGSGKMYNPEGVAVAGGNVYLADTDANVVGSFAATGTAVTPAAGSFTATGDAGDGGPASASTLSLPTGIAVDSAGDVFISDTGGNVVREVVAATGDIVAYAGDGKAGFTGSNGPATRAELNQPEGLALDASGDLFIADSGNNAIREVTPSGKITTYAGTGTFGYAGDGGPATSAQLGTPYGVAVDSGGNLFIADSANNVIRRVDTSGHTITTVAGNYGAYVVNSYHGRDSGDGGPATSAQLNDPQGVAVDSAGDLFIADTYNGAIRVVTPAGTISTLASLPPTAPEGVAVDDATGDVYVADASGNGIDRVTGFQIPAADGPGPGAATEAALAFTTQPKSPAPAGHRFTVTVGERSAAGQFATGDSATTITLSLGPGSTGTLTCDGGDTATLAAGEASFTCTLTDPGSSYQLLATAGTAAAPATSRTVRTVGRR